MGYCVGSRLSKVLILSLLESISRGTLLATVADNMVRSFCRLVSSVWQRI